MKKYLITEALLNDVKAILGETPAKLSATALIKLHHLVPVEDSLEEV